MRIEHGLISAAEHEGVVYLLGNNKPGEVREAKLFAQADLVVDFDNGVILKNRRGPLKPSDSSIKDRLLLKCSRAFEFWGHDGDTGFIIRVDCDLVGGEDWGIIRHYGELIDPSFEPKPSVLLVKDGLDGDGSYAWTDWSPGRARYDDDRYSLANIESEQAAVEFALDLCDGRVPTVEIEPFLSEAQEG